MKINLSNFGAGLYHLFTYLTGLAFASGLWLMANPPALAASCNYIPKGGAKVWNYHFSRTLNGAQNEAGRFEGPIEQKISGAIELAGCTCNMKGKLNGYYQGTTSTGVDSQGFQKIDDYLSVKTEIWLGGGISKYAVVPFLEQYPDTYPCNFESDKGGSSVRVTFRIDRPFVGFVSIPLTSVANFYSSMYYEPDVAGPVEAIITLYGDITVPQSCTINAGQIVTVDFNTISSAAFRKAGERAANVNPVSRTLGIKCSNIDAQAQLTMRVQSDKAEGDAILSDNKDVGFEVTDIENRALTPNSLTSTINFMLDEQAAAKIGLKVFPVSLTGKEPEPGPVMARGYLRIDFD